MLPRKVKVGSLTYRVETTPHPLVLEGREAVGIIDYEDVKISLCSYRDMQKVEQTFWHEVIHAITNDRDIDFGEKNEEFTDALAKGIYALMADNTFLFPGQNEKAVRQYELMGNEG